MKKNKKIDLVKMKGSARVVIGTNQLLDDISKKIDACGDIQTLKNDKFFLEYVCTLIQNAETVRNLQDEEKTDLTVELVIKYFPAMNNENDINVLNSDIQYIRDKKLVKEITIVRKVFLGLYKWLKKKLL